MIFKILLPMWVSLRLNTVNICTNEVIYYDWMNWLFCQQLCYRLPILRCNISRIIPLFLKNAKQRNYDMNKSLKGKIRSELGVTRFFRYLILTCLAASICKKKPQKTGKNRFSYSLKIVKQYLSLALTIICLYQFCKPQHLIS